MFRDVLVGVDGRQGGRDAIGLARQLASSDGGLTLAHVCTPFLGRGAVESVPSQRAEAQRLLERERDGRQWTLTSLSATRFRWVRGCTGSPSSGGPTCSWSGLRDQSAGWCTAACPATSSGTRRARCSSCREERSRLPHPPTPSDRSMPQRSVIRRSLRKALSDDAGCQLPIVPRPRNDEAGGWRVP